MVVTSKALHEAYVKVLEAVLNSIDNERSKDRKAALQEYAEQLAIHLEHYEKLIYNNKATGRDALSFLMEQHNLTQPDLADDLGGQSVVSDILHGKRKLNVHQIQNLSRRFHVNPSVFIDG
ncbi:MAG: helix-turn-helix domain-containing protein [Elusimicrobia bacterium]|nr:helix-turn-helix domain-containing protein [Elusimicrobiota bacterium]